jgi:DNA-binding beta-propeller fold protein YncE
MRRQPMRPVFISVLLAMAGCSNFAEYSGIPSAGVVLVDPDELAVIGCLGEVEGARVVCPAGPWGDFFVTATTGELHRFNAVTMSQDTSFTVGSGSSAGYCAAAYIPGKNTLYVVGAQGEILEVSAATNTVRDIFTAGSSPSFMVTSRNGDYVYAADPVNNRIHGIRTTSNQVLKTCAYNRTPTVLCSNPWGADTLLVATDDPSGYAYIQPMAPPSPPLRARLSPVSDMAVSSQLGLIAAAHPGYGQDHGTVSVIDTLCPMNIRETFVVPGDPTRLTMDQAQMNLFILTSLSPGQTAVYSYNFGARLITDSLFLTGTPVDMALAGGCLVVLTY